MQGAARPCWWCRGNSSDLKIVSGFSSIAYGSCVKDYSAPQYSGLRDKSKKYRKRGPQVSWLLDETTSRLLLSVDGWRWPTVNSLANRQLALQATCQLALGRTSEQCLDYSDFGNSPLSFISEGPKHVPKVLKYINKSPF